MSRRSIGDQAAKDALETLTRAGPKRPRRWESEQRQAGVVVTYRGIPAGLQARVKEIAGDLGVNIGEVARAFLEAGVASYESGDLQLETHEITRKNTLYPGGHNSRGSEGDV